MNKDAEIATFIVKHFLSYPKIDLEILKSKFQLDSHGIRECLIRLYFKGKVFGKIKDNFLFWEKNANTLSLEDVIDEPLSNYDLQKLINQESVEKKADGMALDEDQLIFQQMRIISTLDVDFARQKETSKDEPVSIESRFGFSGYKLKLKIKIRNNTPEIISNCRLKINFPNVLLFFGVQPDLDKELNNNLISINVGNIGPKETSTFGILFNYGTSKKAAISGVFQYTNSKGFARLLRIDEISTSFILPKFIAGTLTIDAIKGFMKDEIQFKHILAFGVPKTISQDQAQEYMERVVNNFGFINISKIKKDNITMAFYSGRVETPNREYIEVLCVPQIKSNIMQLYAAAKVDELVISLLRSLALEVEKLMLSDGVITTANVLLDLNCINCGAVLPKNPAKGEELECKFCQLKQVPWL